MFTVTSGSTLNGSMSDNLKPLVNLLLSHCWFTLYLCLAVTDTCVARVLGYVSHSLSVCYLNVFQSNKGNSGMIFATPLVQV